MSHGGRDNALGGPDWPETETVSECRALETEKNDITS